jgi:hypothetical protein
MWVRLSFAYFSLAKQRKVGCRRATPGTVAQPSRQEANKFTPTTKPGTPNAYDQREVDRFPVFDSKAR